MSALASRTITVWSAPTSSRRYHSRRAAYMRWAKDLIFAECECHGGECHGGAGPVECAMHTRLFHAPAWACDACGAPSDERGSRCWNADGCGAHTVVSMMPSSAPYQRVRARLARWLTWRDASVKP